MRERDIERYFVGLCQNQGWLCEKFESPGKRGVPDRIVIAGPCCHVFFVELKTPTGRLSPLQRIDHERRKSRGCKVYIIRSKYEARDLIAKIRKEINGKEVNDAVF